MRRFLVALVLLLSAVRLSAQEFNRSDVVNEVIQARIHVAESLMVALDSGTAKTPMHAVHEREWLSGLFNGSVRVDTLPGKGHWTYSVYIIVGLNGMDYYGHEIYYPTQEDAEFVIQKAREELGAQKTRWVGWVHIVYTS